MRYTFPFLFFSCFFGNLVFAQDVSAGKSLFQECAACHSINSGEILIGPSMAGVYGRRAGTTEGFRYSSAVKKSGFTWDEETLDVYILDPQAAISGNRMPYSGMSNAVDRRNLIAYIKTL